MRLAKNGAAAALTALRPANASPEALVFRGLNGQSIGRRFAAAAKSAGVEGVTAHSGRVGSPANSPRPEPAPPKPCSPAAGRLPAWWRTTAQAHQLSAVRLPSTFEGPTHPRARALVSMQSAGNRKMI